MARSKLVQTNKKIAQGVTAAFGKIESTVVGGYTRLEDAFVDRYLTREGETVAQAKARLKEKRDGHKG